MGAGRKIAVDLFSGVRGMTLGFEKAGFDVVASVDIDPVHCLTHHIIFLFGQEFVVVFVILNRRRLY